MPISQVRHVEYAVTSLPARTDEGLHVLGFGAGGALRDLGMHETLIPREAAAVRAQGNPRIFGVRRRDRFEVGDRAQFGQGAGGMEDRPAREEHHAARRHG